MISDASFKAISIPAVIPDAFIILPCNSHSHKPICHNEGAFLPKEFQHEAYATYTAMLTMVYVVQMVEDHCSSVDRFGFVVGKHVLETPVRCDFHSLENPCGS